MQRLTDNLLVRMSPDHIAIARRSAEARGISVSALVRMLLLTDAAAQQAPVWQSTTRRQAASERVAA